MPARVLFTTFCCLLFMCCTKSDDSSPTTTKGDRHLGMFVTLGDGQTYPDGFGQAVAAGMDCMPLTLQWTDLDANGQYDPKGLLADANGFYPVHNMPLSLCVSPIAAANRDWPSDLAGKAFDDAAVIARFNRLLDTIHKNMPATVIKYLLIGNEGDVYLSNHREEWPAYTRFCLAVRQHARSLWGASLLVGAETTLGATIGSDKQAIAQLNDSLDLVCLTYYPLNDNFTMRPVNQVSADLEKVFAQFPNKKVLLQECGYATSSVCNSSEELQAAFIHEMFRIWDLHASQLSFISFFWLHDLSATQATQVTANYGFTGTVVEQTFSEYVRTLGLYNFDNTRKAGLDTLRSEASRRGWKVL